MGLQQHLGHAGGGAKVAVNLKGWMGIKEVPIGPPAVAHVCAALTRGTQESLEQQGFSVTLAENGNTGLAEFSNGSFDLCLIDIMLPEKDGLTLANDIRQINPDVPIVFVTAK